MRDWHPSSPKTSAPIIPTRRKKEENGKTVVDIKERVSRLRKGIGPAFETRQSHTIECTVSKVVPKRCWMWNKKSAVLRGSAARRPIRVPICDQSTACNQHHQIRHKVEHHIDDASGYTRSYTYRAYIILLQIDDVKYVTFKRTPS